MVVQFTQLRLHSMHYYYPITKYHIYLMVENQDIQFHLNRELNTGLIKQRLETFSLVTEPFVSVIILHLSIFMYYTIMHHLNKRFSRSLFNEKSVFCIFSGSYYTMSSSSSSNLRIVVLNTNLYLTYNKATDQADEDPAGQYQWFDNVMKQARVNGEKVLCNLEESDLLNILIIILIIIRTVCNYLEKVNAPRFNFFEVSKIQLIACNNIRQSLVHDPFNDISYEEAVFQDFVVINTET